MDVLKYLPRGIVHSWVKGRKEKSGLNRARARRLDERRNGAATLETNINLVHDNAELKTLNNELQEEAGEAKVNYEKLADTIDEVKVDARKVKHINRDYLATILTGDSHRIKPEDFDKYGINAGLVRIAQNAISEANGLRGRNTELRKDSLVGIVEVVCIANDSERLPLFVYHNGEMTYTSPRFNKMTEKGRYLATELDNNPKIKKRVDAGKKTTMEYAEGAVYFVPEKLENGEIISIGHYVPTGRGKISKTYAQHGGAAVKAIYKTLKIFDKLGLEFVKHGKD